MTELADLRSEVLAARERAASGDPLARVAADGLAMIYDRLVPPGLRLLEASEVSLTVIPAVGMSSLAYAETVERFARAVAVIGREIAEPSAGGALTQRDYTRAPVRASSPPGGPLLLTADVTGAVLADAPTGGRTYAQAAMARLVNILPTGPGDLGRVASSRAPTLRAVREVALAAKRLGGLRVALSSDDERAEGAVDKELAEDIIGMDDDLRDEVGAPYAVRALWDGMHYSRREFFLRYDRSDKLAPSGLVDESLAQVVRDLSDGQAVVATIQDVRHVRADGRSGRTTRHLVDIRPDQNLGF